MQFQQMLLLIIYVCKRKPDLYRFKTTNVVYYKNKESKHEIQYFKTDFYNMIFTKVSYIYIKHVNNSY